ncbi:uncharacterized protein I206_105963 [Kwoniella pini CBS 10737]|uniref:fructose-2,6-bisphosphate 2-phosphatase n=1 Tax=Kwoniella pini CBS 10737 TaxID=1296096 RepID=A0A1B9I0N9_9TREE|nr:6-phosphofructo-2-kinase/fructose-2,6-bisphosphatase [Kwoniella pini CBS 10737]OCF49099.1 6-phosphofructo-2-kinase/fructose-2,6-bisphosphatase [Kwoniella pini CBS 10737]
MSMPPPPPPNKGKSPQLAPSNPSTTTKSPTLSASSARSPRTKPLPMTGITPPSQPEQSSQDQSAGPSHVDPEVLANAVSKLDMIRSAPAPMSQVNSPAVTPGASGASSPKLFGIPGGAQAPGGLERLPSHDGNKSVPGTPHFGAQTDLLRTLDESTKILRQTSKAPSRAPSVSGIGTVVEKPDYSEARIVVAMVGLPARGKSYLSNKLMRYLRWLEYNVDVFNVGQLRRSKARAAMQTGGGKVDHSATYFSHSNAEASRIREQLANESLESLISWLKKEGNVGIMDATNSTRDRREWIRHRVAQEPNLQLMFLESFCDDPVVIAANVALKASSGDPDYAGMSREDAERDFRKRIEQYESVYQTITEPDISYCRILNVGQRVTINRIQSYLQSRVAFYLMNLHLKPRSIYLSRHGESMYNVEGKIGGDSDLSPRGFEYAKALPALVRDNIGDGPLEVWTSTLQRTQQTGSYLPFEKKTWKSLDELDAGVCDGMTYEEIEEKYPEDYESRDEDKFNYRYRGGESYRDVVVRLEPVIMELERQENILIIAHQAILRCLYAYFHGKTQEELPYIKIPLHTLIKISPRAYGCHEERYPLPIAAVDTHRPKPKGKKGATPSNGAPPHEGEEKPEKAEEKADFETDTSVARDYFGDKAGKGIGVKPESVSRILEEKVQKGDIVPTAQHESHKE